VPGWAQQISTCPSAGGSSGSGEYVTSPDSRGVLQVWQTPVRQLHRARGWVTYNSALPMRYLSPMQASSSGRPSTVRFSPNCP